MFIVLYDPSVHDNFVVRCWSDDSGAKDIRLLQPVRNLTCASDDNVHLSDDLIQFHKSEAVHAKRETERERDGQRERECGAGADRRRTGGTGGVGGDALPCLQGADGVDLCDVHDGTHCFKCGAAAFAHLGRGKDGGRTRPTSVKSDVFSRLSLLSHNGF